MKILIITPSFAVHGGIRIILEWANRLPAFGHQVSLYAMNDEEYCSWFTITPCVQIIQTKAFNEALKTTDVVILTSPQTMIFDSLPVPKTFVFMQMLEHLFNPGNQNFQYLCKRMYTTPHPLITISKWNMSRISQLRNGPTYYVGNGVNFDHFPMSYERKFDQNTILVEGWESGNASKDVDGVACMAAERLKQHGYKIIAFSQKALTRHRGGLHEYHILPSLQSMNHLYSRAYVMLKATRYDARSCAPMEAMTKGTPTIRAIIEGDDDLTDGENCFRVGYDWKELYEKTLMVMKNYPIRAELSDRCMDYVKKEGNWSHWIELINRILTTTI